MTLKDSPPELVPVVFWPELTAIPAGELMDLVWSFASDWADDPEQVIREIRDERERMLAKRAGR